MNSQLLNQKSQAFGWHLLLSFILASLSLFLVYFIWYPTPLSKATGVEYIYKLMLLIDVILGPTLTFIIYKKPKKTLKMDLAIILIIQLSALLYGLYSVYQGKPAWIVYDVDRFQLVRMNEIDTRKKNNAKNEYKNPPIFKPKIIASILPKQDIAASNEILFDEVQYKISPAQRIELYKPLDKAYPLIIKRARDLSELNNYNDTKAINVILKDYPDADSYLPLKANAVDMAVLVSKEEGGKVIKIVDLRPW